MPSDVTAAIGKIALDFKGADREISIEFQRQPSDVTAHRFLSEIPAQA
jgi:hypothetical protein